jgi:hypothetical protein
MAINLPTGTTTGDVTLGMLVTEVNTGTVAPTFAQMVAPTGWTIVPNGYANFENAGESGYFIYFRAYQPEDPATTSAWSWPTDTNSQIGSWVACSYTGTNTAAPIDATNNNVSTTTGLIATALSATPTSSSDMMTMWFTNTNSAPGATLSTGTIRVNMESGGQVALEGDQQLGSSSATGNQTLTWTSGLSSWGASQVLLRPASVPVPTASPAQTPTKTPT